MKSIIRFVKVNQRFLRSNFQEKIQKANQRFSCLNFQEKIQKGGSKYGS